MKLVATSDWHLDQSTAGVDRYEDICQSIDESVDAAIAMEADAYLMCGDLADPNTVRSHRAVAKATEVQTRLRLSNVIPMWLVGNHDVIEDGSGFSTMESLKYCSPDRVNHVMSEPGCFGFQNAKHKHQCNVIHLPFTPSSHPYDPDDFIRGLARDGSTAEPILVVGHLNLQGISAGSETVDMPRGRDVFWPIDALQECFPNAVLVGGHYHTPQDYKGVHIIGSMARLRFDETHNTPGYSVMDI